ncbi:MAG: hypothetical protein ACI9R3_000626 [Verrucomicrobiales bacterium]|jgi:hypothetical protein
MLGETLVTGLWRRSGDWQWMIRTWFGLCPYGPKTQPHLQTQASQGTWRAQILSLGRPSQKPSSCNPVVSRNSNDAQALIWQFRIPPTRKGAIPPHWIVFHPDSAKALHKQLLALGFSLDGATKFENPELETPAKRDSRQTRKPKAPKFPRVTRHKICDEMKAGIRAAQKARWNMLKKSQE